MKQNIGCSIYDIYIYGCDVKRQYHYRPSRIAKANGIIHKRISNKIICKDMEKIKEDRKIFAQRMNYDMNNVIFLDEVSFCINDHQRYEYGVFQKFNETRSLFDLRKQKKWDFNDKLRST